MVGIKEKWFNKLPNPESMPVPGCFSELTTKRKRKYYTGDFWYENDLFIPSFLIRNIKIKDKKILLNGKEIHLKGFGKHEDFNILGKATNESLIERDFECMKWIGSNCFRTSHYPYAEEWYRAA